MCELLALSTSQPARLTFSLHTLASHGSEAGSMHDGWGVAFFQDEDVALFREPLAASGSALVHYLETQGPSTNLAISHIRHATRGTVRFANTQPFMRELGGRMHVFAHNGDLPGVFDGGALARGSCHPIGQTDSERAFCILLERIRPLWTEGEGISPPSLESRLSLLASFAAEMRLLGPANFLYADGDALFAHGHRRRQGPGEQARPPGLWALQRHCAPATPSPDGNAGVSIVQGDRAALFIASVPLTDEAWQPLSEGELVAVRNGEIFATRLPVVI